MNLNAKGKTPLSKCYCHSGVKQRAPHSQAAMVRRAWEKNSPSVCINICQWFQPVHRRNHHGDKVLPRKNTGACARLLKTDAAETCNTIINPFTDFTSLGVSQISESFPTLEKKGGGMKIFFYFLCPVFNSFLLPNIIWANKHEPQIKKNSLQLRVYCQQRTFVWLWNLMIRMSLYTQIQCDSKDCSAGPNV